MSAGGSWRSLSIIITRDDVVSDNPATNAASYPKFLEKKTHFTFGFKMCRSSMILLLLSVLQSLTKMKRLMKYLLDTSVPSLD